MPLQTTWELLHNQATLKVYASSIFDSTLQACYVQQCMTTDAGAQLRKRSEILLQTFTGIKSDSHAVGDLEFDYSKDLMEARPWLQ